MSHRPAHRQQGLALGLGLALLLSAGTAAADNDGFNRIEQGRYLATVGDCAACHTAKGGQPFAGGVTLNTPFGKLVGANITPDRDTGIGKWTLADFQRAMSEGHGRDGKRLYGAMPYTDYTKVTRDDNAAIWSYLRTLQPVRNAVDTNLLPFPFNQRSSLAVWNAINFHQGEFQPTPGQSVAWNRGAYLVQGLGHCGACHTPKNLLGGDRDSAPFTGFVVDGWLAPDITNAPGRGIGQWSADDIVAYLKTGANRYDIASGPMAEEVSNSSQHWTDADLRAVATYLKAGPSGKSAPPPIPLAMNQPGMRVGQAIYLARCAACHVASGVGQARLFPRLAKAPLVNNDDPASLIRVVLAGSRAGATDAAPTGPAMPSFGWNLDDAQVAQVLTYVRNSWGNAAPAVPANAVRRARAALQHE